MKPEFIKYLANIMAVENDGRAANYEQMAEAVLDTLLQTQLVTFTFDDPEGGAPQYPSLEDLVSDMELWDDGKEIPWAIHTQIELRDPTYFVTFKDGKHIIQ